MAWRSSGSTNSELVENLFENGLIESKRVRDGMLGVDRAHYCPSAHTAYEDSPQTIGHDATISAPHMHACACESLLPYLRPGAKVLDVGSGSGYLTAVLAELVAGGDAGKKQGKVIGLEHIPALRNLGEENMRKSEKGRRLLNGNDDVKVEFVIGDGRKGWTDPGSSELGWDAIHVGAAASELHQELVDQLRKPGRLFIPVEDDSGMQNIWTVDKDAQGEVSKKMLFGVRYVPLTDAPK